MGRGRNVGAESYWIRYAELSGETTKDLAVAIKAGVSTSTLSSWKTANRFPPANSAVRIAEFFGSTVEYMVDGSTKVLPYEDGRIVALARKHKGILERLESLDELTLKTIKIQVEAVAQASALTTWTVAEETAKYGEKEK